MTSKQTELVRSLFKVKGELKGIPAYKHFFTEDVRLYGPASGQIRSGIEALKQIQDSINELYQMTDYEFEEIFEQEDKVIVQWTANGIYKKQGEIRPRKDRFRISGMSVYQFERGKIAAIWQFWDRLGILEQVGEVQVRMVEPGYYYEILKKLGMEAYVEKATLLSKRERDCLNALLKGKTAKETATNLKLSPRTIEAYLESLKKKLKCTNKGELFVIAQALEKLGLL